MSPQAFRTKAQEWFVFILPYLRSRYVTSPEYQAWMTPRPRSVRLAS